VRGNNDRSDPIGDGKSVYPNVTESSTPRALLVTIPEAAAVLAVGRTTIYELIWSGQLTPVHIGRCVRLAVAPLEQFVEGLSLDGSRSPD
jgi:excisionase family DNA binding protein